MKRMLGGVTVMVAVMVAIPAFGETVRTVRMSGDKLIASYRVGDAEVASETFSADGVKLLQRSGAIPDGPVRQYANGKVIGEWEYKNGRKDGMVKRYHDNGKLRLEAEYHDGVKNGVYREFRSSGAPIVEEHYRNGRREGLSKIYLRNGKLFQEVTYAADQRIGLSKTYFASGRLGEEATYANGKRNGVTKIYFDREPRQVERTVTFKNDRVVSQ